MKKIDLVHDAESEPHVAVVIPCYRVRSHISSVLARIGPEVTSIFVVDDMCPQGSGQHVKETCRDKRVQVLFRSANGGVGAAVKSGYDAALRAHADIIVKVDGDGQMAPELIPALIQPIVSGAADYTKGNRFFSIENVASMPAVRVVGNGILSFVNKIISGYWQLMDPTNGFTAIHRTALSLLPLQKLADGYFFESDMLFRLSTIRAVVMELPMRASYGQEQSNLKVSRILFDFPPKFVNRFLKRIFYVYLLRDFNLCSLQLFGGLILLAAGFIFGTTSWYHYSQLGVPAPTGTVMLSALPVILGFQLLLAAASYDVSNIPRQPIQQLFGQQWRPEGSPDIRGPDIRGPDIRGIAQAVGPREQ